MVEILSKKQLKAATLKQLKEQAKNLQKALYPIDYSALKDKAKQEDDEELQKKIFYKAIKHAQKNPPKESSSESAEEEAPPAIPSPAKLPSRKTSKTSDVQIPPEIEVRYNELNKMPRAGKKGEQGLRELAAKYKIKGRTNMKKHEVILAIIEVEKNPPVNIGDEKYSNEEDERYLELHNMKNMTLLREIAGKLNIPKYKYMKKYPLLSAIMEAEGYARGPIPEFKTEEEEEPVVVVPDSDFNKEEYEARKRELSATTMPVLREMAAKLNIPKYKSMDKYSLMVAIADAESSASKKEPGVSPRKSKPSSPGKVPGSPKKSKSPKKDCGEFSYDELVSKRLGELKELLQERGVEDVSQLDDEKKAAHALCQLSKHKELCDDTGDYKCGENRECDITSSPGICSDTKPEGMKTMEYKGNKIIGSKIAIKALKKLLKRNERPEEGAEIQEMCNEENDYACGGDKICDIDSDKCIDPTEKPLQKGLRKFEYKGSTIIGSKQAVRLLKQKLGLIKPAEGTEICTRENDYACVGDKICDIDSDKCIDPAEKPLQKGLRKFVYNGHTIIGSKQAVRELKKKLQHPEGQEVPPEELAAEIDKEIAELSGDEKRAEKTPVKKAKKEKVEPPSEPEEEDAERTDRRKKQAKIDARKVEQVISDVMSEKQGKLEDFSQIQNTVLKCLGLLGK